MRTNTSRRLLSTIEARPIPFRAAPSSKEPSSSASGSSRSHEDPARSARIQGCKQPSCCGRTREKDTQALRYDSYVNEATMECEVHEA